MWKYIRFVYSEQAQLLKDPKQPSQSWHSVNFNMNCDIMICNHRGPVRLFHCISCLSKLFIEGWQNFELLCYFQGQPYALTWILIISLWGFIFYCSDIVVTGNFHPQSSYPLLTKEGKAFRRPADSADSEHRWLDHDGSMGEAWDSLVPLLALR